VVPLNINVFSKLYIVKPTSIMAMRLFSKIIDKHPFPKIHLLKGIVATMSMRAG
jgi:hypothetical protein